MPTYNLRSVKKYIDFDIIEQMDANEGKLTLNELLVTIAVPCTRLDYENTPYEEQTRIMREVRLFVRRRKISINAYTKEGLKDIFEYEWLASLSEHWRQSLLMNINGVIEYPLIETVTSEGYVVLKNKNVDLNRRMMANDSHRIEYTALRSPSSPSAATPVEPLGEGPFQTVRSENIDGYWTVPTMISAEQWYKIIKDASPSIKMLISYYLEYPGHRASCKTIGKVYGVSDDSINMRNTLLGTRAKKFMGNFDVEDPDGHSRCWSVAMNRGMHTPDEGFVWEMRPELVEAAERLKAEGDLPEAVNLKE